VILSDSTSDPGPHPTSDKRDFATGVYGYTFTKPFDVAGLRFEPLYDRHAIALERGRDTQAFHLTGVLLVPIDSLFALRGWTETFFDLEAALTFCERQRVTLSHCVQLMPGEDIRTILLADEPHDLKDALPMKLAVSDSLSQRGPRRTSGACLQFDAFASDMRTRFLALAMKRLSDADFQHVTGFRSAFFRNTEMVKMGEAPIDVTHSLLFTGLELRARKALKPNKDAKLPYILRTFLEAQGFGVTEDEARQIAQCRNALFHRGELVATYHTAVGNVKQAIKITELPNLDSLFTDVLLKVLGFDDPEINWNRWRDRMAFQGNPGRPLSS
jgi:hypothetical protein